MFGVYASTPGIFGTLPGWLTFLGVAVAAWIFYKGGGGTAISSLEAANRVLEHEVKTLKQQRESDGRIIAGLEAEVAALSKRTDFAEQISPLVQWAEKHDAQVVIWVDQHEKRAQERFEKTLTVLDLIADRLGPDNQ